MIVKILSNAGTFSGIRYNERKNDQGSSELLLAKNFDALGHGEGEISKADYVQYLKMIASLNPRVDKKQFHAIISTKGRVHSPDELKDIAVQYMEKMGYGENPFLIYSHSDTPNNHVHIVTCRVDKKGKKIDDSFERVRSQKVIQEILAQHPLEELKTVLHNALLYQCDTLAQYKLLLERQGYFVQEKENTWRIIKHGVVQQVVSKELITKNLQKNKSPEGEARKHQLKAIFERYKPGMDTDYFIHFAKQKFRIDIVLHQKKGHDTPYGYTIIDHTQKYAFKGSQVMRLKSLLARIPLEEKIKHLHHILKALAEKQVGGYSFLKNEIQTMGFQMNDQGQIFRVGEEGGVLVTTIDHELLKKSKYRDRVQEASTFQVANGRARKALAQLFFINPEALESKLVKALVKEKKILKDKLQAIAQVYTTDEGLKKLGLELLMHKGECFVLDRNSKILFDYQEVGNEWLSLQQAETVNLDNQAVYSDKSATRRQAYEEQIIGRPVELSSILSMLSGYEEEDGRLEISQKKKKKR